MWQCGECELPGVRPFMAMELHRTILGAEVSSDRGQGTKQSQLGTPRVQKAPEPEGRAPSAGLPGHYQRTSLDLEYSLGFAVAELPSQESPQRWWFGGGLNLCRFLGGMIVRKAQKDGSI